MYSKQGINRLFDKSNNIDNAIMLNRRVTLCIMYIPIYFIGNEIKHNFIYN